MKKDGLIKNIGVSNFTTNRLIEAQKHTENRIVVNQVLYNFIYRQPEDDGLVEYCQKNDVLLEAFRPVERGALISSGNEIVNSIAKKYQKTPAQIALNWLISQQNIVTIFKTNNPSHLAENLGALGWQMESGDVETLRKNFPGQQTTSDTPMR